MKILIIIIFCGLSFCVSSQSPDEKSTYSQVIGIKSIPFSNIGDSTYWNIVKGGLSNLPKLICLLDDSTNINIPVPYFGRNYSVADVSYNIITDIIYDIPTLDLLQSSGCSIDETKGFFNYWNFLSNNESYRKKLKKNIEIWYEKNKNNLTWVNTKMHRYVDFSESDPFDNPAGGYYILKK